MPRFSLRELLAEARSETQERVWASSTDPGFFKLDLTSARVLLDRKLAQLEADSARREQSQEPVVPPAASPVVDIGAAFRVFQGAEDSETDSGQCRQSQEPVVPPVTPAAAGICAAFSVFQGPEEESEDNN